MKNILYICMSVVIATSIMSCNSEDEEAVNLHDPNEFFEPAPNAQDEESMLRRAFQEKYGCYLLFNDTIQKRYIGDDINGDSVFKTELLALDYTVPQVAYASNYYTYTLLKTIDEKKSAVEFLETHIFKHITNKLMPYSWFLCNQINYDNGSDVSHPYAVAGQRCIAISTGILPRLRTEAQINQYVSRILVSVLGQLLSNNSEAFEEFFALSEGYYSLTFNASSEAVALNYVKTHGFLDKSTNLWGGNETPSHDGDLNVFATYSLNFSDEYIEKNYANYPVVLKKWYLFKEIIGSLGFNY